MSANVGLLDRTWRSPSALWAWFTPVNHRIIGKRFIVTAFVFFLLGGLQALLMRAQLAQPEVGLLSPDPIGSCSPCTEPR